MDYKKIILRWQKDIEEIKFIKRDFEIDLYDVFKLRKILVLVWPRRVWKTFMFYQIIDTLLKERKIKLQDIVYINFANIFFKDFNIEKLLEEYFTLFPTWQPVFFFDEIQELYDFEKVLLYLQSNKYQIFATWSNSKLLSKEISTNLRWKYLEKFVYPLTFKEFLRFKNFEKQNYVLEEDRWKLKNLFFEFLIWWNFPEIVLAENSITKRDLIVSYFKDVVYIDLVERYKIENEKVLLELMEKILKTIWKEFSVQKFFNTLKSKWIKIWKPTIYNYLQYLENIFFVKGIKNFYKDQNKKFFLYNIGFENILFETENYGQRFENIVFLELIRRWYNVYYKLWKEEIDFFIPEVDLNIQVCWDLTEDNFEREVKPLLKQQWKKVVVYFEKEKEFSIERVDFIDFFSFIWM